MALPKSHAILSQPIPHAEDTALVSVLDLDNAALLQLKQLPHTRGNQQR